MRQKTTLNEDLNLLAEVQGDVWQELGRQRTLYGVQRKTNGDWLAVGMEEVGEACQAMQRDSAAAKETDADDTYTEVVQAAAVFMSWAAQLLEEKKGAAANGKPTVCKE